MRSWFITTVMVFVVACGGAEENEQQRVDDGAQTSGGSSRGGGQDALQVEGLMGTLSTMAINRGLEPRMPRFASCFTNRYEQVEMLGGRIQLSFRVATDGSVRWVYARASTVGDRETERCLLDVAGSTRFSEPQGGEAEFNWPLALDPPEDVRPPFNWETDRIAEVLDANGGEVLSSCRPGASFIVTVYVAPGGAILTAGASTVDQQAADAIDCIVDAVKLWEMPDPGSYPAKVTFELN